MAIDTSGGTANLLNALGRLQGQREQESYRKGDTLRGLFTQAGQGVQNLGKTLDEVQARNSIKEMARSLGIDPNDPALAHPRGAMLRIQQAIAERTRASEQQHDVGMQEARFGHDTSRQAAGFTHAEGMQTRGFGHDTAEGVARDLAAAERQKSGQGFQYGMAGLEQQGRRTEREAEQTFRGGERALDRSLTTGEGALDRSSAEKIAGIRATATGAGMSALDKMSANELRQRHGQTVNALNQIRAKKADPKSDPAVVDAEVARLTADLQAVEDELDKKLPGLPRLTPRGTPSAPPAMSPPGGASPIPGVPLQDIKLPTIPPGEMTDEQLQEYLRSKGLGR